MQLSRRQEAVGHRLEAVRHIAYIPNPKAVADSRFALYKPEERQLVRKQELVENRVLKQLAYAFKEFITGLDSIPLPGTYERALALVKNLKYSAEDIQKFVIGIAMLQEIDLFPAKAGIFLSALINNCVDHEFVITTKHLVVPIFCFGYRNTKIITVEGDLMGEVGYEMESGILTVNGNVLGDSSIPPRTHIGAAMSGGKIVINGDSCGEGIAASMRGGEIHLNGDYKSLAHNIMGGKVYHNGKLIGHNGFDRYDY